MTQQNLEDERIELSIMTRPYEPGDLHFVLNSWMRSFRLYHAYTPDKIYYASMQTMIQQIMQRPSARCVVACDATRPEFIFGFVVADVPQSSDIYEPLVVHYAFTKLAYRTLGIGRKALQQFGWHSKRPIQCTFWTRFCRDTWKRFHLIQNDFILRGIEHGKWYQPSSVQDPENTPMGENERPMHERRAVT